MAEPTYIQYGDLLIEQQTLFNDLANNVNNYINDLPWSKRKKDKFLNFYLDVISKGISGASNTSGLWALNLNDDIDLTNKSKRDLDLYHEVAYFILNRMGGLAQTKEDKKTSLPLYDNTEHQKAITGYIGNNMFGGQNWDYTKDWDTLDERDKATGILGTSTRMAKLASMLEGYANSLEEGKYNFEGTAFANLDDLKSRLNDAVRALRNGEMNQDVKDTLNRAGINWRNYLHDGSEEIVGLDDQGNPVTRGDLINLRQLEEQKALQTSATKTTQANKGVLDVLSGVHGTDAKTNPEGYSEYLAKNLGVGLEGFNKTNTLILNLLNTAASNKYQLDAEKKRLLGNFLYYIRTNNPNYTKSNLSDFEWAELNKHANLQSTNREGFVRLPWKTSDGRYTFADDKGNVYFLKPTNKKDLGNITINRHNINEYRNNFLKGTSVKNAQDRESYLRSRKSGLTSAETAELASIGFDIASVLDPEMISAGALALTGSGLRNYAAASQPGGMSTSDKWWQAADYGLSILGSVPVLGDAALTSRALNNLRKAIVPLGLVMAGANVPQAAKAAYNKVVNGEDLTILDWRAIGAVITAAVGGVRGHTMQKRAEALQRTGGTATSKTNKGVIKTSKGNIEVDEATAKLLKENFGKLDKESRTKILRENTKVKEAAKKQGIDLANAEVAGYKYVGAGPIEIKPSSITGAGNRMRTLRAMAEYNRNHGWLARKGLAELDWILRKTGGYEDVKKTNWFKEAWSKLTASQWDSFGKSTKTNTVKTTPTATSTATPTETPAATNQAVQLLNTKKYRDLAAEYRNTMTRSLKTTGGRTSNVLKDGAEGKFNDITFKYNENNGTSPTLTITTKGKETTYKVKDLFGALERIAKVIEKHRVETRKAHQTKKTRNEQNLQKTVEQLRKLKKDGFLRKQGGILTNVDLDTTISNFLNKLK